MQMLNALFGFAEARFQAAPPLRCSPGPVTLAKSSSPRGQLSAAQSPLWPVLSGGQRGGRGLESLATRGQFAMLQAWDHRPSWVGLKSTFKDQVPL